MSSSSGTGGGKCPYLHSSATGHKTTNQDWWPDQLNLKVLNQNSSCSSNPMPASFDYSKEFAKLGNLSEIKADLTTLMTNSQDWWPADYGHYGPFFIRYVSVRFYRLVFPCLFLFCFSPSSPLKLYCISFSLSSLSTYHRMAWHAAGTYRIHDGRGGAGSGQQRFAPLNSWPDNGNLDKARRLLLPIKQKYGKSISWGDLYILAGNVALESMNFPTFGFAGGRIDVFEPEEDVNWGYETTWLSDDKRYGGKRDLDKPLGAVQMGLIYVNPEGPAGNPYPLESAKDIRETFGRMAMSDEETVALIAGGHTFGKCHGAGSPEENVGVEPEAAPLEAQGFGWKNKLGGDGKGKNTITSGLEGAWTYHPTKWDNDYFNVLFGYDEWELFKSPAGAQQWRPTYGGGKNKVPDAHDPNVRHPPIMLTSDLALRYDPIYNKISRKFYENPELFKVAFGKAWYKLCHRDMGPYINCLGPEVPPVQKWQDPVPDITDVSTLVKPHEIAELKKQLLASISPSRLVATAWASASTYRKSDKRGGTNGGRIRLEPQISWQVNEPIELSKTLKVMEQIQSKFHASHGPRTQISMADLIVLGGCAGIEAAAIKAGHTHIKVPFTPGRTDATQEMTDVESFAVLEPIADGFRNYVHPCLLENGASANLKPEEMLIDKACLLGLTAPELTVLIGGLRVMGIGCSGTSPFTNRVGVLTNDFFVNLLDMGTVWSKAGNNLYEGRDRTFGRTKWTASRVDLEFGSNSILRAISEEYSCNDAKEQFVHDFVSAFTKVMNASGLSKVQQHGGYVQSNL